MISLSLLMPPPYLTYILICYEGDGIQCPELNQELINSPHIYAVAQNFILVSAALRGPLDAALLANLILDPLPNLLFKDNRDRETVFFYNSCFIVGAMY